MWYGKTAIEKGYFRGEGIWLVKEKIIHVINGYYTTCEKDPPHYYFYSPRLKIFLDDMVLAKPIVLTIHRIPVAMAPFWFFPIGRKRKSGLLPFKFGNSTYEGQYAKGISYYWVINDYSDLTFTMDVMEKKGIKLGFEGIWIVKPFTSGRIGGSYIREIDTKRERWNIAANTDALLFYGVHSTAHVDMVSDASYINDYAEEPNLWVKKEGESNISFSKSTDIGGFSLVFSRKDNFQDSITIIHSPNFSFFPKFITIPPLSFSSYFSLFRKKIIEKKTHEEEVSLSESYTLTHTGKIFGIYNISNSLTLNEKRTFSPTSFLDGDYNFTSTCNFHLYRIFWIGKKIEGILHDIAPSVGISFSPNTIKDKKVVIPRFDTSFSSLNLIFSLHNNFEAKIAKDTSNFYKIKFLRINLSGSYDFKSKKLSPISLCAELPVFLWGSITFNGTLYPDTMKFSYFFHITQQYTSHQDSTFPLFPLSSFAFSIDHGTERNTIGNFSFILKPGFGISLNYSTTVNITSHEILSNSLVVNKDLHCWEAIFSLYTFGKEIKYDIKVRIKEIPEVEIGKGLLGFLFPQ